MKTIEDLGSLEGKKVLVRADFNVPLDKQDSSVITDDGRIVAALPTIKYLLDNGAAVILCAHLGRPVPGDITTVGEKNGKEIKNSDFTLAPVVKRLGQLLQNVNITMSSTPTGPNVQALADELEPGKILMLENIRFDARETSKVDAEREEFATELAELADYYVSDGFGVVHRKQASVYDIAKILPSAAGRLVFKEVAAMSKAINDPQRPVTVVLGGSKVSDKLGVISNLLNVADNICIGGGMAYTFLKAQGYEVGKSLLEEDQLDTVLGYIKTASEKNVNLLLPIDTVIASDFPSSDTGEEVYEGVVPSTEIPADMEGLDIGPETVAAFGKVIESSKTVVWNGPSGVFEKHAFASGTAGIAAALTRATQAGAFTIIGGGDSAAAARILDNPDTGKRFAEEDFSHISTGGGASLEFLEGKVLPGLDVLK
jgi:phosphoglycerate kinase